MDETGTYSNTLATYQDISGGLALLGVNSIDYAFSVSAHLIENVVIQIENKGFGDAVNDAAKADVKQTTKEVLLGPAILTVVPVTPIISKVITFSRIFKHVRHCFLQD